MSALIPIKMTKRISVFNLSYWFGKNTIFTQNILIRSKTSRLKAWKSIEIANPNAKQLSISKHKWIIFYKNIKLQNIASIIAEILQIIAEDNWV